MNGADAIKEIAIYFATTIVVPKCWQDRCVRLYKGFQ